MPLLHVLTPTEIKQYESPAHFDDRERKKFFTLPPELQKEWESLRNPGSHLSFILQVGYFCASQRFFGSQVNPADLAFVADQLSLPIPDALRTPKQTLARYRQMIIDHYGFRQLAANDQIKLCKNREVAP